MNISSVQRFSASSKPEPVNLAHQVPEWAPETLMKAKITKLTQQIDNAKRIGFESVAAQKLLLKSAAELSPLLRIATPNVLDHHDQAANNIDQLVAEAKMANVDPQAPYRVLHSAMEQALSNITPLQPSLD
jgi:hypothetical protein